MVATTSAAISVREHEVGVGHAGHAVEPDLGERHHASVGGEEDQAGGGDAEPERLREDDVQEEVRRDERRQGGEDHDDGERHPAEPTPAHGRVHAGLPNSPSGRTASTPTSSAKVTMIE